MNNQKNILNYFASWSVGYALIFTFLVPFAIFLGLTNFQIGIISAMPFASLILSQVTAMLSSGKVARRKTFVVAFLLFRRIFLIPLLALPFISNAPVYFIVLVFVIHYLGQVPESAFMSLLADIIPEKTRGRFFARKEVYIAIFTTIPYIIAGFFLDIFPKNSPQGFIILFALGIIVSFFSLTFLASLKEPEYKPQKQKLKNLLNFRGEYGKFTVFTTFFNFAYMIASPFFVVYILKNLGLGYSYFVLATSISIVCRIIFLKPIGRMLDRYGDRPVAIVSTFATALVPLTYLLFVKPETVWLIIPAEILSGIAWAGFDLSSVNLLLDFTTKEDRMAQVAKFNAVTAIPMIIAPIIGGFLSEKSFVFLAGIPLVFAVSSVARAIAAVLLFRIREVRVKKEYPLKVILRAYVHMPLKAVRTMERGFVAFVHHRNNFVKK